MTAALEEGEWSAARPGRTLLPGKTRYPFYRRLGGPQGRTGRAENLVPTGIRSRTVQHVVSRYTDWDPCPPPTHIYIYLEATKIRDFFLHLQYRDFSLSLAQEEGSTFAMSLSGSEIKLSWYIVRAASLQRYVIRIEVVWKTIWVKRKPIVPH